MRPRPFQNFLKNMIETPEVARAVELARAGSMSLNEIARTCKIARSTLTRALRRHGIAPAAHPSGPKHHAWVDGRKARQRAPTP